jgi:hypothetical protein
LDHCRGTTYPRELLTGYEGHVQVDALGSYKVVAAKQPGITLVGCWAHARRRFFEATKVTKKTGAAHEGLSYITNLYRIERELRNADLSDDEFLNKRSEAVQPQLERFRRWLAKKSETVVLGSLLGKTVAYTLGEWDALNRYLDHPALTHRARSIRSSKQRSKTVSSRTPTCTTFSRRGILSSLVDGHVKTR